MSFDQCVSHRIERNIVWPVAAVVTILKTKHLFANGFHFPSYVLLAHVTFALVLIFLRPRQDRSLDKYEMINGTTLFWTVVRTISTAGALICAYQAMLHLQNLTFLIMILTLPWPCWLPVDPLRRTINRKASLESVLRFWAFLGCVAFMYTDENHLSARGIPLSLAAAVFTAVSRWSTVTGSPPSTALLLVYIPVAFYSVFQLLL